MIRNLLPYLLFVGLVTACSSDRVDTAMPSVFLVLPDAANLEFEAGPPTDSLVYSTPQPYPATEAVAAISAALKAAGWTPLEYDYLNPTVRTSHTEGWRTYDDVTVKPVEFVFQWCGEWKDDAGNVVQYVLQYRDPTLVGKSVTGSPNNQNLLVKAVYVPSSVVTEMLDVVRRR